VSHRNYGSLALSLGQDEVGFAHALAAAVISVAVGSGRTDRVLTTIATQLAGFRPGTAPVPTTWAAVTDLVQALPGVRLDAVARSLTDGDPEPALREVLDRLAPLARDAARHADGVVRRFDPLVELACRGQDDPQAAAAFDVAVAVLEYFDGFQDLGEALRRFLTPEPAVPSTWGTSGPVRLLVLATVERCRRRRGRWRRSVAQLVSALDGHLQGQVSEAARTLSRLDRLVHVAPGAVAGSSAARAVVDQELAALSATQDWSRLVPRIRAALDGERGELLLAGVDAFDRTVLRRLVAALDGSGPLLVRVPDDVAPSRRAAPRRGRRPVASGSSVSSGRTGPRRRRPRHGLR
jgi:hypothetical protein